MTKQNAEEPVHTFEIHGTKYGLYDWPASFVNRLVNLQARLNNISNTDITGNGFGEQKERELYIQFYRQVLHKYSKPAIDPERDPDIVPLTEAVYNWMRSDEARATFQRAQGR